MKHFVLAGALLMFFSMLVSCSKSSFINSADAAVGFSADTLHFDTVFTSTGSVTQSFKIFNLNDQTLQLSSIQLMGGTTSPFKINVDGTPGTSFSNIDLAPNDSLYVFASVTINTSAGALPFIVQDSIQVNYNGNTRYIQLQAYGQNTNFLTNKHITKDSVWTNNLPFVIAGGLTVDSRASLTIQKGCKIYLHANAPFIVDGSLKVNGDVAADARVIFQGDRLDPAYRDLPAAWPGITFSASSSNNVLTYTIIKNANQGINSQFSTNTAIKIVLNQCIIDNIYDAGITSVNSSIKATNCLISNCGSNISIAGGGNYSFTNCTVASYENSFISHKNPVLTISNGYQNTFAPLLANFTNCIFYGEGGITEDEILVDKKGSPTVADYTVSFKNVLYKNKTDQPNASFLNSIKNVPPQFENIDVEKRIYNFHLQPTSPAIHAGVAGRQNDLDGKIRTANPTIGCYED